MADINKTKTQISSLRAITMPIPIYLLDYGDREHVPQRAYCRCSEDQLSSGCSRNHVTGAAVRTVRTPGMALGRGPSTICG